MNNANLSVIIDDKLSCGSHVEYVACSSALAVNRNVKGLESTHRLLCLSVLTSVYCIVSKDMIHDAHCAFIAQKTMNALSYVTCILIRIAKTAHTGS